MIEPRSSILLLQKRDSQDIHSLYGDVADQMENSADVVLEHDEPEIPIHPALEYEIVAAEIQPSQEQQQHRGKEAVILCNLKLVMSFAGLVIFGSANSISLKLQAIPMYNYPNFLNLFTNLLYIPICFLYIIPAAKYGWFQSYGIENPQISSETPEGYSPLTGGTEEAAEVDSDTSTITDIPQEDPPHSHDARLDTEPREINPFSDIASTSSSSDSELQVPLLIEGASSPAEQHNSSQQTLISTSRPVSYRDFAVMGLLDSLATTMQILSAAYLPGPLLMLLPQAAIPLTLVSASFYKPEYKWTQYVGAATVALGIVVLIEPLLTNRRSPSFYCEAINDENDCTVCQMESNREACLAHLNIPDEDEHQIVLSWLSRIRDTDNETNGDDQNTPEGSLCQWLPFEEATRTDEILTFVWSMVLIASCVPMTLSTFYKEWAMKQEAISTTSRVGGSSVANTNQEGHLSSNTTLNQDDEEESQSAPGLPESDPIYLNGWIAIFQLFFTVPLCMLGGLVSSPEIQPTGVLANLYNGFLCYFRGMGSVTAGCHPDEMCGSASFWLVNFHLLTTVGYSFCMMYCLKYGSTTIFFLALTVMVPLGTTAFILPFMPEAVTPELSDFLGSAAIVLGLILYRFFDYSHNTSATVSGMDGTETNTTSGDELEPIRGAFFALPRDFPGYSSLIRAASDDNAESNGLVQSGDV